MSQSEVAAHPTRGSAVGCVEERLIGPRYAAEHRELVAIHGDKIEAARQTYDVPRGAKARFIFFDENSDMTNDPPETEQLQRERALARLMALKSRTSRMRSLPMVPLGSHTRKQNAKNLLVGTALVQLAHERAARGNRRR